MSDAAEQELPLLSIQEAVAEVRRWLEVEGVDPEQIFAMAGGRTITYGDLVPLLETDGEESRLLRIAIGRGRAIRGVRGAGGPLQITRSEPPHEG